jgi:hypothetical protein
MPRRTPGSTGFTLLPVVLTMSLVAAIAFLLNRDNGVNANLIGARSDGERARYAAEAGLQAANYTIQGLGCAANSYPISISPVTDSNFGGAAYSAYANNTSGSPLTLTSTGSYNGASVTLTRSAVYVYQSRRTITVPPSQDTYVDTPSTTRNYGAATTLKLKTSNDEPLLQFDLSAFAPGSRPIRWYNGSTLQPGAQLALYQLNNPASSGSIGAYLITRSWLEGTQTGSGTADGATWNTYDGINAWPLAGGYNTTPLATSTYVANGNTWYYWDITDAAVAWMSGVYPNYGVWMRSSSGNINNAQYVSSDDTTNVTLHPGLIMNYLLPCGATAPPGST